MHDEVRQRVRVVMMCVPDGFKVSTVSSAPLFCCMNGPKRGYMSDVDNLIQATPLAPVLQHFDKPTPQSPTGEHRMQCVFNADCADSTYGQLAVNQDTPAKVKPVSNRSRSGKPVVRPYNAALSSAS